MITLYSGTPGSGKSLHMAKNIFYLLKKTHCLVIANFDIKSHYFTSDEMKRFIRVSDPDLESGIDYFSEDGRKLNVLHPACLQRMAEDYQREFPLDNYKEKEQQIRLFIDECQIYFNARDWQRNTSKGWPWFFSVHRHFGFQVVLCSQMDTNLDKQVRGVIEYNIIHRKVSNIGLAGAFVNFISGGGLFYAVMQWYPMRQKVDGSFFKYKKRFGDLYDTHAIFSAFDKDGVKTISKSNKKEEVRRGSAPA